jgi:hypothetical protein
MGLQNQDIQPHPASSRKFATLDSGKGASRSRFMKCWLHQELRRNSERYLILKGTNLETPSVRKGRPPGSAVKHPDLPAEVWITVRVHRIRTRVRTGKTPSVRKACHEVAAQGGIISAVGGNVEALEAANTERDTRWQRFEIDSKGPAVIPSATGTIFAGHAITDAGTLRARYSEADRIACSDRRVRFMWMNLCRQRLGRPARKAWSPS